MRTRRPRTVNLLLTLAAAALTACGATPVPETAVSDGRVDGAAVQPAVASLSVYHRQAATLPVTLSGMTGTVQLRLDAPDGYTSGLRLDTTTLTLDGTATRDLTVSAPGLPDFYTPDQSLSAAYTLVVSQGGRDLARAPVTIEERLLDIRTAVRPDTVTARPGQTVTFTVVVTVTPALDGPLPVTLDGCPVEGCDFEALPVGDTTGDGGTMTRQFALTVPASDGPPAGTVSDLHYAVGVADFAGYRRSWYGTTAATVTLATAP